MRTSPLLARREIPANERLQKALTALVATAAVVAGAWYLTGASPDSSILHLGGIALLTLAGLVLTAFVGLRRHESGRSKEDKQRIRERIADDRSGRGWLSRSAYNLRRFVFGVVIMAGWLVVISGAGLFCYQVFVFLKSGQWMSLDVLRLAYPYVSWLQDPQSWYGLHGIVVDFLGLVPVSLALIAAGWLVAGFGSALRGKVRR